MSDELSATLELYPGGGEVALRQIGLGVQPLILIEPRPGEDGDIEFRIIGSLLDQEELTQIVGFIHTILEQNEDEDEST